MKGARRQKISTQRHKDQHKDTQRRQRRKRRKQKRNAEDTKETKNRAPVGGLLCSLRVLYLLTSAF
jgi:hypothetical protein